VLPLIYPQIKSEELLYESVHFLHWPNTTFMSKKHHVSGHIIAPSSVNVFGTYAADVRITLQTKYKFQVRIKAGLNADVRA
jgi:hypothetical protein